MLEQIFIRCFRVGFYFKHKVRLIGISDETSRHKFYCTVCMTVLYFSTWRFGDFRVRLEERLRAQRSKQYGSDLSVLIPQEGEKPGKDQRKRRKLNSPAKTGSDPVPGPSSSVSRDPGNPGVSRDQISWVRCEQGAG